MRIGRRTISALLLIALALGVTTGLVAKDKKKKSKASSVPQMDDQQRAIHALNRLSFGPRPGDVEKVRAMGVDKWIDLQLHPDRIDDSAVEARLAPYRTLHMSTAEIVDNFPPPQLIKEVAAGREPMPKDPVKRAIYEAEIARYQNQQERKAAKAENAQGGDADNAMMSGEQQKRRETQMYAALDADKLLGMAPDERYDTILKMDPDERQAMFRRMKPDARQRMFADLSPQQQETVVALVAPELVVTNELMAGKLMREAYSERQLQEVMTDFWFNHFNVFIGKGPDRYLITEYERDVIRPHALGKFKDLLEATAKSPAMLFYLDNWQSVGPDSDFALYGPLKPGQRQQQRPFRGGFGRPRPRQQANRRPPRQKNKQLPSGLNENYAREIMELHTLGVDGGYTQKDVTELARVLTGWTIKDPRKGGGFYFNERMHEPGTKIVLGHTIKQNGEKEGEEMIEILARSPATAHHICFQLAQRFVSDNPPEPLVDRMAKTFLDKDGDIREVLKTLFKSPEFWSEDAYRAKVKTPLEFVVSAVRATGADIENPQPLIGSLNQMGMPLYGMQPPTGYSTKADAWVNSAALLNRLNFALALGSGRMKGINVDPAVALESQQPTDADSALALLENSLLSGDVSEQTHETIRKQLDDPQVTGRRLDDPPRPPNVGVIAGLILGSPEFQKH